MKAVQGPQRRASGSRTLPLRFWLVLAVVAVIGAGFLAQVGLTAVMTLWDQHAENARMATVQEVLGTEVAYWRSAAWQRRTARALGAEGVDAALYILLPGPEAVGQQTLSGAPVYATSGAHSYLAAGGPGDVTGQPVFERLVIGKAPATGVALLWLTEPAPGELPQVLWPVIELGTFAFTLAIVVWLVGLPVLHPLAELSRAAESMAGGDLDVKSATASPVREIAAVSSALAGTAAALRESLACQSALEEDRRLFIAAVAHDLRTPLFMLRGYLKGLERGVAATPEKVAQYVSSCTTQADALERRIADLFDFTRLEYLDQQPERAPLELGDLLEETVQAARQPAATRQISLTLNGPNYPCHVLADRRLLVRVVENLLDNAVRHTPEGGRVVVGWSRCAGTVTFTVADTGPGIRPQDLPHLFTPLYRGEESRNRQSGGAGLGLSIARRILRVHDGDLIAANVDGAGAVFTATLRTAPEMEQTGSAQENGFPLQPREQTNLTAIPIIPGLDEGSRST